MELVAAMEVAAVVAASVAVVAVVLVAVVVVASVTVAVVAAVVVVSKRSIRVCLRPVTLSPRARRRALKSLRLSRPKSTGISWSSFAFALSFSSCPLPGNQTSRSEEEVEGSEGKTTHRGAEKRKIGVPENKLKEIIKNFPSKGVRRGVAEVHKKRRQPVLFFCIMKQKSKQHKEWGE